MEKETLQADEKVEEILSQGLEIKEAIQIAKILANAPEERLPMILDVFTQANLDIAGIESVEMIRALAKKNTENDDMKAFIEGAVKLGFASSQTINVPAAVFEEYCKEHGVKPKPTKQLLAELSVIRVSSEARGSQAYSVAVYDPAEKKTMRCVSFWKDWRERLGVAND